MFLPFLLSLVLFTNSALSARRFNGPEHQLFGNKMEIKLVNSTISGEDFRAPMEKLDVSLSFGDLIAFAGDFYGPDDKNEVICLGDTFEDRVERGEKAFNKWYGSDDDDFIEFVIDLVQDQLDVVTSYEAAGYSTFLAYEAIGLGLQEVFDTRDLLNWNWDHFNTLDGIHDCNRLAFEAMHYYAQTLAADADDDDELIKAYAVEGFAHHYYTDAFAAGHIRTARDVTIYKCDLDSLDIRTGLMVNMNHNQDNYNGVVVSFKGETMRLYGDGGLLDHPELEATVLEAVQERVDEIYEAYVTRKAVEVDVPYPIELSQSQTSMTQTCALFKANDEGDAMLKARSIVPDENGDCDYRDASTDDCPRVPPKMWFDVDCPDDADDVDDCETYWHAVQESFSREDRATDIVKKSDIAVQIIAADPELSLRYLETLSDTDCRIFTDCCDARQKLFDAAMDNGFEQQKFILNFPQTSIDVWKSKTQSCRVSDTLDPIAKRTTTKCFNSDGVITVADGSFIDQSKDFCSGFEDSGSQLAVSFLGLVFIFLRIFIQ